jgi:hypothetical protein
MSMMTTEKRLIDANAMREDWLENGENEYVYDTNAVLCSIDAQPTVDAMEVVHGRWEKIIGVITPGGNPMVRCSVCKSRESEHLCYIASTPWRYCPNCGAKMDGENCV